MANMKGHLVIVVLMLAVQCQAARPVPKRLFVRGKWYVVYDDARYPEDLDQGVGKWGSCSCKGLYIQINPNQAAAQKRDTVWHEINHALNECDDQAWKYVDYDSLFSDFVPWQLDVLRSPDRPYSDRFG